MRKISLRRAFVSAVLVSVGQCLTVGAQAAGYDDQEALSGLKEVKVAFDVTTGDAKALLGRLKVIDETRQSLIRQGVTPHFVITFRGPATKLIQTDATQIKPEDRPMAAQIAAKLSEMRSAKGVENLEQCAVAVREQGTKPENVIPAVKVVGNAWISLMAYQSRGYAYIAP
jgi:intracellular sulfur oxidation DsrE/DsrF family protein